MKFDYVIGNPPYQEEQEGDNKTYAPPIYNLFLDNAYEIADKVEMIHPARFLFNAGSTPKAWNKKMLNDKHLKVLFHEQNSANIFPNTDIKGGIAVTYHDKGKVFGAIGTYTPFEELNRIKNKVTLDPLFASMSDIVMSRTSYGLSDKLHEDYPNAINQLTVGHSRDMSTNIFEKLPEVFYDEEDELDFKCATILGLEKGKRTFKKIKIEYITAPHNFWNYKVLMPSANGSGAIGEVLSTPLIGEPLIGGTETFISMGDFNTAFEAEALLKYVKTKFARVMLGILKVTQHITPEKWTYVPIQDFTEQSDIDWSQSVSDIDRQLYQKYRLSQEEIDFIETHVKEMS